MRAYHGRFVSRLASSRARRTAAPPPVRSKTTMKCPPHRLDEGDVVSRSAMTSTSMSSAIRRAFQRAPTRRPIPRLRHRCPSEALPDLARTSRRRARPEAPARCRFRHPLAGGRRRPRTEAYHAPALCRLARALPEGRASRRARRRRARQLERRRRTSPCSAPRLVEARLIVLRRAPGLRFTGSLQLLQAPGFVFAGLIDPLRTPGLPRAGFIDLSRTPGVAPSWIDPPSCGLFGVTPPQPRCAVAFRPGPRCFGSDPGGFRSRPDACESPTSASQQVAEALPGSRLAFVLRRWCRGITPRARGVRSGRSRRPSCAAVRWGGGGGTRSRLLRAARPRSSRRAPRQSGA